MSYDYLGGGSADGAMLGQDSSELVGFWGITPCDQPAALTAQLTTITCTAAATADYEIVTLASGAGTYGFVSLDEAESLLAVVANLQARMAELETNLVQIGVIAGGTAVTAGLPYDYLDKGNDDGTVLGYASTSKVGFWGITPCDQPASLTAALTTITMSAPATADYAIQVMVTATGYKFADTNEAQGLLMVVQNLQTRLAEVEARLVECGLNA